MISTVRKYVRVVAMLACCGCAFIIRYCLKIIRPFSTRLDRRVRQLMFMYGMKGVLAITGIRLEVRGTPPKTPFLLVSNHLTFLDVCLLGSQLGCVFVSREDLEHWPVFGFISREMNTIFIDRARLKDTVRVNELISKAIEGGFGIVMFPEAGVSQNATVLPFKSALFESPVQLNLPVHYATIHYETPEGYPPASEIAVWKDGVGLFEHYLGLAALPHFNAILTFGDSPITASDRKELAGKLFDAVQAQFIPLK